MTAADGQLRVLMPDGHSLTLSPEAAERSAMLLLRAASRASTEARAARRGRTKRREKAMGQVIPVDFIHHARIA